MSATQPSANPFAFDPFDPRQTQEMWPLLARMRREAPVVRPAPGFVYVALDLQGYRSGSSNETLRGR